MENKKSLIITGVVVLIIIALVITVIYYLIQFIRSRQTATPGEIFPQASVTASPVATGTVNTPTTGAQPTAPQAGLKTYNGAGFGVQYPQSWGLLTCNNSPHFEFDPSSPSDQANMTCDVAVKPVTVLVGAGNRCSGGEQINLGGNNVTRVKDASSGSVDYTWCVNGPTYLEFSHRVSPNGTGAYSSQDYSTQVEQIISNLRFGQAS